MNQEKYKAVAICPTNTNGSTGCCDPIHNNIMNTVIWIQKKNLEIGLNWFPLILEVSAIGIIKYINKAANIAITPNNLSGILLKIA